MQMKTAHLVSILLLVAILLAALPSPSAIREPRDPKILTTTTSSVLTTVTATKIVTTVRHTSSVTSKVQSSYRTLTFVGAGDPGGRAVSVSYQLCLVQWGVQQSDGSVWYMPGYAYAGIPPPCPEKLDSSTDVLGRKIVIHQFNETWVYV
jgi:hypothetical protein